MSVTEESFISMQNDSVNSLDVEQNDDFVRIRVHSYDGSVVINLSNDTAKRLAETILKGLNQ